MILWSVKNLKIWITVIVLTLDVQEKGYAASVSSTTYPAKNCRPVHSPMTWRKPMTDHLRDSQRSTVKVKRIAGKAFSSNIYIIQSQKNFIVDAGAGPIKRVVDYVDDNELDIDRIILSHRHFDHVGGAEQLSEALDAPLYAHELAAEALREGDDRTIISGSFGKRCKVWTLRLSMKKPMRVSIRSTHLAIPIAAYVFITEVKRY